MTTITINEVENGYILTEQTRPSKPRAIESVADPKIRVFSNSKDLTDYVTDYYTPKFAGASVA